MAPKQPRLFDPKDFGHRVDARQPRGRHLHVAEDPSDQSRLNGDGTGLVPGRTDGLPVRVVKPHSAKKAMMVGADLGTVGRAMAKKWFEVHYLELFCGPGCLLDEVNDREVPGSPLQALTIQSPFNRYVFADFSQDCTDALDGRIAAMRREGQVLPPTEVRRGDANDPEHLERVCALIDPRALVLAYLDPAKPNLHWSAVEYLAGRFPFIDFIINLPFSAIHRSLTAGGEESPRLVLNHPHPMELVDPSPGQTAENIRVHYIQQLHQLGFVHTTRRCVHTEWSNSPLYDVILASRKDIAVKLFEAANGKKQSSQLGLLDAS